MYFIALLFKFQTLDEKKYGINKSVKAQKEHSTYFKIGWLKKPAVLNFCLVQRQFLVPNLSEAHLLFHI